MTARLWFECLFFGSRSKSTLRSVHHYQDSPLVVNCDTPWMKWGRSRSPALWILHIRCCLRTMNTLPTITVWVSPEEIDVNQWNVPLKRWKHDCVCMCAGGRPSGILIIKKEQQNNGPSVWDENIERIKLTCRMVTLIFIILHHCREATEEITSRASLASKTHLHPFHFLFIL